MSVVWEFFSKNKDSNTAICVLCSRELAYSKGSTSSLKRHTERYHSEEYENAIAKKKPRNTEGSSTSLSQPTLSSFLDSKKCLEPNSSKAKALTDSIVRMICKDLQPLSFTEDEGFRLLMKTAEPRYVIPSRQRFRQHHMPEAYRKVRDKLLEIIKQYNHDKTNVISITTDGWTSKSTRSYVTYTLHLIISPEWILNSYVLGTYEFRGSHTANNLLAHLKTILVKWGFLNDQDINSSDFELIPVTESSSDDDEDEGPDEDEEDDTACEDSTEGFTAGILTNSIDVIPADLADRIFITTDNASNVTKAVKDGGLKHIGCFAHTVNLAVQRGLKPLEKQLNYVRRVVKFFHQSSKATQALQVTFTLSY